MSAEKNTPIDPDRSEILQAWRILCPNGRDAVTRRDVERLLEALPEGRMHEMDLPSLFPQKSLTVDDVTRILHRGRTTTWEESDVIQMAFELLDPHGHGFIDASALRDILSVCVSGDSFSEVSDGDVEMIIQSFDHDQDGRISLQDFAQIQPRPF